jgi:hypothetical protein
MSEKLNFSVGSIGELPDYYYKKIIDGNGTLSQPKIRYQLIDDAQFQTAGGQSVIVPTGSILTKIKEDLFFATPKGESLKLSAKINRNVSIFYIALPTNSSYFTQCPDVLARIGFTRHQVAALLVLLGFDANKAQQLTNRANSHEDFAV